MEKKMNNTNIILLLLNTIKGKKGWIIFSTIVLVVIAAIIPSISEIDRDIYSFYGVIGIMSIIVVLFFNCINDLSFLHEDNKFSYYKSKPILLKTQIFIHMISNLIFMAYLFIILFIIFLFYPNNDMLYLFKMIIPFTSILIMVTTLSSIITGNSFIAAIMSIFNMLLPIIIYLIVTFMLSVAGDIVYGFGPQIIINQFSNFYRLDYIYFANIDDPINITYISIFLIMILSIFSIITQVIKRRKNEDIGKFIIFSGYRNLVAVISCMIVPMVLSNLYILTDNISMKVLTCIILSALSYYLIVAFFEKSFKIPVKSLFMFAKFMVLIISFSSIAVGVSYKNFEFIPEIEDIEFAGISGYYKIFEDNNKQFNGNIYKEKANIEYIKNIHKIFIDEKDLYKKELNTNASSYNDVYIYYKLKNGNNIIRKYRYMEYKDFEDNINIYTYKLVNSDESKSQLFKWIVDEKMYNLLECEINGEYDVFLVTNEDKYLLRENLIKDLKNIEITGTSLWDSIFYNEYFNKNRSVKYTIYFSSTKDKISIDNENLESYSLIYKQMDITDEFKNTINYIDSLVKKY